MLNGLVALVSGFRKEGEMTALGDTVELTAFEKKLLRGVQANTDMLQDIKSTQRNILAQLTNSGHPICLPELPEPRPVVDCACNGADGSFKATSKYAYVNLVALATRDRKKYTGYLLNAINARHRLRQLNSTADYVSALAVYKKVTQLTNNKQTGNYRQLQKCCWPP
jgi:hypothetical protein